jgi:hypothetical protein
MSNIRKIEPQLFEIAGKSELLLESPKNWGSILQVPVQFQGLNYLAVYRSIFQDDTGYWIPFTGESKLVDSY